MQNNITTFDKSKFIPYSIGFDSLFDRLFDMDIGSSSYPPYNISKVDEHNYIIEMAVAGFSKNDVELELSDGELTVRSKENIEKKNQNEKSSLIHQGISNRSFVRKFTLSDEIFIKNAEMRDGMLRIKLEKVIPEHKKPKLIDIK
ncbi:MAG: heat-shock protein [Rickettsiales bacterium]|nr:heat-shock protein [Rickettsiales bacterium]|tara:strand:+ start:1220 stop:1654 length:435 start_codon:yes stop_codon:yes gene_type:complete